jgi:hypothetical protein
MVWVSSLSGPGGLPWPPLTPCHSPEPRLLRVPRKSYCSNHESRELPSFSARSGFLRLHERPRGPSRVGRNDSRCSAIAWAGGSRFAVDATRTTPVRLSDGLYVVAAVVNGLPWTRVEESRQPPRRDSSGVDPGSGDATTTLDSESGVGLALWAHRVLAIRLQQSRRRGSHRCWR